MTPAQLPPREFNPTVFEDEERGGWTIRVHCWGREIARIWFNPVTNSRRDWARVVHRWGKMIIDREYRKWLANQ